MPLGERIFRGEDITWPPPPPNPPSSRRPSWAGVQSGLEMDTDKHSWPHVDSTQGEVG